jgi:hypothetical protein
MAFPMKNVLLVGFSPYNNLIHANLKLRRKQTIKLFQTDETDISTTDKFFKMEVLDILY